MAMRPVVSSIKLRRLVECNWQSSASSFRYFSDDKGRILSEEERAKETVYIQKMERERMEKMKMKKMKAEQLEKADKNKSHEKAEEEARKG